MVFCQTIGFRPRNRPARRMYSVLQASACMRLLACLPPIVRHGSPSTTSTVRARGQRLWLEWDNGMGLAGTGWSGNALICRQPSLGDIASVRSD